MKLPTRMIVVKLGDGSLWINSPVSASQSEIERLAQVGHVEYLVAPTRLHVWRLPQWKAFFPAAQLWGPPGIARRYQESSFTGMLGDEPPAAWVRYLDQLVFRGNAFLDEVEFLHMESRTLIVADFIPEHRKLLKAVRAFEGYIRANAEAGTHECTRGPASSPRIKYSKRP